MGLIQSKGDETTRFLMALPAPPDIMEKIVPLLELVTAMRKYDLEVTKAGIMLACEGLHPTSKGARLRVSGGKPVITDGPFTEAKEVIAGFWMIQVKSKEEALEWAKRCPLPETAYWTFIRYLSRPQTFHLSCGRSRRRHSVLGRCRDSAKD
jgi:hypothetical protein